MTLKMITRAGAVMAAALISAQANAADMYARGMKDAPVYVPAASWTGFYLGGNGGYGWSNEDSRNTATVNEYVLVQCPLAGAPAVCTDTKKGSLNPEGGFGGGQIGYNVQLHSSIVVGVEADIDGADIKDSTTRTLSPALVAALSGNTYTSVGASETNFLGTVRGRIGCTLGDSLIYFTGGFAYGGVKDSLAVKTGAGVISGAVSKSETETGYVLGGGVEHRFSPSWSIKAEYQYVDLGETKLTIPAQAAPAANGAHQALASSTNTHTYNTVRVGLNYRIAPGYEPLK
jgi:outer membrane immunogenic protein